jgi:hypothetical protein
VPLAAAATPAQIVGCPFMTQSGPKAPNLKEVEMLKCSADNVP